MRYADFFSILDDAGLSPEQAAERLGVSNMTLRRWRRRPGRDPLPEVYARAFQPALEQIVVQRPLEGQVAAAPSLVSGRQQSFLQTLKNLGFPDDIFSGKKGDQGALIDGLAKVGEDEGRKRDVDLNTKKISGFVALSQEWRERIQGLLKVIRSQELLTSEKLVAYGALFYLLSPIDLIPDHIPVIGLLDDFVILGIALWFYKKHHPKLFKKKDA